MSGLFIALAFWAAFVGVTVPGFVAAIRALPPIERWVLAGYKPWACDVCMCFWSTGTATLALVGATLEPRYFLVAGPAYTLALIVSRAVTAPTSFPPPPDSL